MKKAMLLHAFAYVQIFSKPSGPSLAWAGEAKNTLYIFLTAPSIGLIQCLNSYGLWAFGLSKGLSGLSLSQLSLVIATRQCVGMVFATGSGNRNPLTQTEEGAQLKSQVLRAETEMLLHLLLH